MYALPNYQNQQPQAWHENLEMIIDIVIRFNIHLREWDASRFQVSSMV